MIELEHGQWPSYETLIVQLSRCLVTDTSLVPELLLKGSSTPAQQLLHLSSLISIIVVVHTNFKKGSNVEQIGNFDPPHPLVHLGNKVPKKQARSHSNSGRLLVAQPADADRSHQYRHILNIISIWN